MYEIERGRELNEFLADLLESCAAEKPLGAKVIFSGGKIARIDQRMSRNPHLSNNGGDYDYWINFSYDPTLDRTIIQEDSSCELPQDLRTYWVQGKIELSPEFVRDFFGCEVEEE